MATLVALSLLAVSCTDLRDPVGVQRPSAPSFSVAPADLSYVGDADDLETGGIQLTIPLGGTAGAAWLLGVQRVNDGFESEFTFQVEPGTTSGDGFAFVIQGNGDQAIGNGAFGYEGLENSVAVVFDTRDASSRVSLAAGGVIESPIFVDLDDAVNDGLPHSALITYFEGTWTVVLDGDTVLVADGYAIPASPLDAQGQAWVGFTASNAGEYFDDGEVHSILDWTFRDSDGPYPLFVTVTDGSNAIANVTAVATNVETGEFFAELTGQNGLATFDIPAAEYVVSAYRFAIDDESKLVIWPFDGVDETNSNLPEFAPVIYLNGGSVPRTTESLFEALESPVRVGPAAPEREIMLEFSLGALVQCTFVDSDGNLFAPGQAMKLFGITPLPNDDRLPPINVPEGNLPPGWSMSDLAKLPSGFGFGIGTVDANQTNCSLAAAAPGLFAIESAPIERNGKKYVLRAGGRAGSDGIVSTTAGFSPFLAETHWFLDELIDDPAESTGPRDIGPIVYGWLGDEPDSEGIVPATNTFGAAVQFKGLGVYTVELTDGNSGALLGTLSASCSRNKCTPASNSFGKRSGVTVDVTGTSVRQGGADLGTVVFYITAPDLESVCFDVYAGGSAKNPSDALSGGPLCADKADGRGQTFILAGRL